MKQSAEITHDREQGPDAGECPFHFTCFACGPDSLKGLRLKFDQRGDCTNCTTTIDSAYQSYQGIAHGGIITTLLDAAMVRCLYNVFRQQPFTCRLDIRFWHSIPTNVPVDIKARVVSKRGNRCTVEAEIFRRCQLHARAHGVFMLR